jgi:hypothetical protein
MMLKLKNELGLVVLPILVFFFLIMSYFTPNKRYTFISLIPLVHAKGIVLQTMWVLGMVPLA